MQQFEKCTGKIKVENLQYLYELTDGEKVWKTRWMTKDEFAEAQKKADDCTDGNCFWRKAK